MDKEQRLAEIRTRYEYGWIEDEDYYEKDVKFLYEELENSQARERVLIDALESFADFDTRLVGLDAHHAVGVHMTAQVVRNIARKAIKKVKSL